MKICYIASAKSIHTQRWVNAFADLGHEVFLITATPVPEDVNCKATVFDVSCKDNNATKYLKVIAQVRQIVWQIQPDILHAHYATGYGLLGNLCNYHPFLISVWGSDIFEFPTRSIFHKWLLTANLNVADAIASTSYCMAIKTKEYIASDKNVYVTPFGIDLNLFTIKENINLTIDGNLTIGVVKALEPTYGIDNLVRVFIDISIEYPKLKLMIVGDGSQYSLLNQMIANAQLSERIKILPGMPHHLVPDCLKEIDVFVIPSKSESFGVVALEASASGLPVIASNVGGLPEVVRDNITGYLVLPDNLLDLKDKIVQLIKSPDIRLRMGKAGREFVEQNYSWDISVLKMSSLYADISYPKC
jgi:L-malate glycosyltransferase